MHARVSLLALVLVIGFVAVAPTASAIEDDVCVPDEEDPTVCVSPTAPVCAIAEKLGWHCVD